MALVLSRREGEDFYIGESRFQVETIYQDRSFVLMDEQDGHRHEIVGDRSMEIMPGVRVSSGDRPHPQSVKVVIEAPRTIVILRGDVWRNQCRKPSD